MCRVEKTTGASSSPSCRDGCGGVDSCGDSFLVEEKTSDEPAAVVVVVVVPVLAGEGERVAYDTSMVRIQFSCAT